jgi:ceramide glucosyltransferase
VRLLAVPAVLAGCYYGIALAAAVARMARRKQPEPAAFPPVSILKPVHGRDPGFYEAIRSHAVQDYPAYEILFGSRLPCDPARQDVERLANEFSSIPIRWVPVTGDAPNGKVAVLIDLARAARHEVLLVNDSDIRVEPGYLRAVAAPLADPSTGVVTCLYRAVGAAFPARFEALGVATDFAPSVLVARALGVAEFALGSTMAFHRERLREIGGFEALREYLADDYQLGRRITEQGYRVAFASTVVETGLPARTFAEAWRHQVRWARTIRVSRPGGYLGSAATHATVWSIVAFLGGFRRTAAATLGIRVAAGLACAVGVLRDRDALRMAPLIPLRDLWGSAVWIAGLTGRIVEWRGERLRLAVDGRIDE